MRLTGNNGFTLIELSLVLVIVALLAGGVTAGTTLLESARVRRFVSDTIQLETAFLAFQTKYSCLPGDCPYATALFSSAVSGNGDGRITCADTILQETFNIWNHLSAASLIPGRYASTGPGCYFLGDSARTPTTPFSSNIYYHYANLNRGQYGLPITVSGFQVGAVGITNNWKDFLWGSGLNAISASHVDLKLDNGSPDTGKVVGVNAREPSSVNTFQSCVSGGRYITSTSNTGCNVYFNFAQ